MSGHVLVIDDDAGLRGSTTLILEDEGYRVTVAVDGQEGLRKAAGGSPDLILVDVRMPGMDGLEVTRRLGKEVPGVPVVVMTAYGSLDLAVEAVQAGAADYLPKPFGAEQLLLVVRKVEEQAALRAEVGRLRGEVEAGRRYAGLVAESPGMQRVLEMARKVAQHPTSVLVEGETGTGKEVLARLVHTESPRAAGPFVPVNCGAIPAQLMESEFFGHVRGAFTGAERDRTGLFESARGGTLFLDEVGELPEALQVKLLRVLQERVVRPVGAAEEREVDVRVLAATNRDLEVEIREGRFRQDLYYRLAVLKLELPPLRERGGDLVLLARHLLERHAGRMGIPVPALDGDAMERLQGHAWPGNVRELENVLERALVLAEGGRIQVRDLPPEV
ncbi:MAG: sigma-54-dependent Fis family transcriptional regulator, partial [Gemmatimonadales bacterium]